METGGRINISASQWRQIVNGTTDTAIISTDERGLVTSWNSGATYILGWTEQEMLGQSLSRIFVEADPAAQLAKEIDVAFNYGKAAERRVGASAKTVASSGPSANSAPFGTAARS